MLIKSLHLKNILSFKDTKLDFQPLNVLIGANGSGKSNLIDVIGLLQAVPNDLSGFLRNNGPTGDWIWKGPGGHGHGIAKVEAALQPLRTDGGFDYACIYDLQITVHDDRVHSLAERLDDVSLTESYNLIARPPDNSVHSHRFFEASDGKARLWPRRSDGTLAEEHESVEIDVYPAKSVLNEIRNPVDYPALTQTARSLSNMKTYKSWYVGRDSSVRRPQRTDGDPNFVEEDFSNLALVVNDLLSRRLEPSLDSYLKRFYESYESLHPRIFGNTIELIVNEVGLTSALPASRLSDGTIRFIALLAILCHPNPPPLICIEDPEIAMHPDSLGLMAELIRKASERTQIIVTTHSPELVDLFSDEPDVVLVCERDWRRADGTQFNRLSREKLDDWLADYTLGEMWMRGAVGGVRW